QVQAPPAQVQERQLRQVQAPQAQVQARQVGL
ncbi:unnamed protein product, partial [Didymodactylos carnosus]